MTGRRTIAILGESGSFCPTLAEKLAQQSLRLLFVSADEVRNAEISDRMDPSGSQAEIEFINCEKEGCWEADIIAFTGLRHIEPELVQRIRKVATQKVVLMVSEENEEDPETESAGKLSELQKLLPHSRVFQISLNSDKMEASITGSRNDAGEVQAILREAGYEIK